MRSWKFTPHPNLHLCSQKRQCVTRELDSMHTHRHRHPHADTISLLITETCSFLILCADTRHSKTSISKRNSGCLAAVWQQTFCKTFFFILRETKYLVRAILSSLPSVWPVHVQPVMFLLPSVYLLVLDLFLVTSALSSTSTQHSQERNRTILYS